MGKGAGRDEKNYFSTRKRPACVIANDSNGWTRHADQSINITNSCTIKSI